jgi:hypothetical protein
MSGIAPRLLQHAHRTSRDSTMLRESARLKADIPLINQQ